MNDNKLKRCTLFVLKHDPKTRASDPYCIAKVFEQMNYPKNLFEIAEQFNEDIYGSITRYRRYWQALYPELRPSEQVTAQRRARQKEKEEEFSNETKRN